MSGLMIKDMLDEERPREKACRFGIRTLSTAELLAILLRTGIKGQSVIDTAQALLRKAKNVSGLASMSLEEIMEIAGIGQAKALVLLASFELARRMAYDDIKGEQIKSPESLVHWLKSEIGTQQQEMFLVIYLNQQLRIITHRILFQGTINEAAVYPREIFKEALLLNSTSLMFAHNHPGGDIVPSAADIALTARLVKVADLMGVKVLDHIIVSGNAYFSFSRQGILGDCMTDKDNQC